MFDIVDIAGRFAVGGLHNRAHRTAALAVPTLDQVVDFRTQADAQLDIAAGRQAHGVDGVTVVGIGHPQHQSPLMFAERAQVELLEESQRQRLRIGQQFRRRLRCVLGQQQGQLHHLGAGLGVVALRHQAQARKQ